MRTEDHPFGRGWAVPALCLGGLTVALTMTLVVPIQGRLPALLDASVPDAGWVVTVTLLAGAVAMPVSGRLGDIVGRRPVLVASALLLVLGSVLCALSSSLLPMLVGRSLQGLSVGFIPVAIALMREVTPPERTNAAVATMSATFGVGGGIGLPLSAWLTDAVSWHAPFWAAGVLGLALAVAVLTQVPRVGGGHGGRIDVVGMTLLAIGLVAVLVAVSKATTWGWTSGRTLGAFAGGTAVLLVWGRHQLSVRDPLCDLRVCAARPVLLTNLAAIGMGFAMMAQSVVVPQLMQLPRSSGVGLGQSIVAAGLWLVPSAVMMLVFAPVSSALLTRLGARRTLVLGAAVVAAGYLMAVVANGAPWHLMVATSISAAGVGIGYAAMPTLILDSVPLRVAGSAVGVNALMRSIGTSLAAASMTAVLAGVTRPFGDGAAPTAFAFQLCFGLGALAAVLSVLLAAAVPADRAAARDEPRVEPVGR